MIVEQLLDSMLKKMREAGVFPDTLAICQKTADLAMEQVAEWARREDIKVVVDPEIKGDHLMFKMTGPDGLDTEYAMGGALSIEAMQGVGYVCEPYLVEP